MVQQEVKVEGMKCSHCEEHLEVAFKEIEGVLKVKANRFKKNIIINSEKGLSEETIKEVIENHEKTFISVRKVK